MKKLNKLTFKKLNEVEFEKKYVLSKMSDLHALIDSLKYDNAMLVNKVKTLEDELLVLLVINLHLF